MRATVYDLVADYALMFWDWERGRGPKPDIENYVNGYPGLADALRRYAAAFEVASEEHPFTWPKHEAGDAS